MRTILIVEDERVLADMYADKLSREGFGVCVAETAEEGIEQAKERLPALVLLDILLGEGNGLQVLRELKTREDLRNIPVIVFSNFDDPHTKKEALDLGAEAYLIKTEYTPGQIVEEVAKRIR